MYTIYCSEYATILENKLTFFSEQGRTSIDKKSVLKFDKDGYLSSVISDDINITINHKGASYDLFFQNTILMELYIKTIEVKNLHLIIIK